MTDDSKKTRRLDDDYFREIAKQAKTQKLDSDKTQILGAPSASPSATTPVAQSDSYSSAQDANKTRVFRPDSQTESEVASTDTMEDPPAGWLVAVDGPGAGSVLTLGVGLNSIGRGTEPRVRITFDDDSISRGKALVVVYDSLNRAFFATPGDGKTLAYIGTSPILEKTQLESGMVLTVGQSKFRFVAFCDTEFCWSAG